MRWLWAPAHYWVLWLAVVTGSFVLRETWALASGRPQDTLSAWVWAHLKIVQNERIGQWSAVDLLIFCVYLTVFVIWLPWHFFFHKFG